MMGKFSLDGIVFSVVQSAGCKCDIKNLIQAVCTWFYLVKTNKKALNNLA